MASNTYTIEFLDLGTVSNPNNLNYPDDQFCNTEFVENKTSSQSNLSKDKVFLNSESSRILKKAKRNSGQAYTTRSGRPIEERKCLPLEKCKKGCANKITSEQQELLFSRYWSLGSYNERVSYIMSLIVVQSKKTHKLKKKDNKPSRNREYSNLYYLEISGERINVCQLCFRKCFGETESFLRNVIKKKLTFPMVSYQDSRGIHAPANKITETQIENHINSFDDQSCITEFAENETSSQSNLSKDKVFLNSISSRILRKLKRNSGQAYLTRKGRPIEERKCLPLEKCKKGCANKITSEQQKLLFSRYWSLGSYNERVSYIMSLIVVQNKKKPRKRKNDKPPKKREYSNLYYVEFAGKRINVCKLCFRKCFGETQTFLRNVMKKKLKFPMVSYQDTRGLRPPANKMSEIQIGQVKNYINSYIFDTYKGTNEFLSSDIKPYRIYKIYKEVFDKPISSTKFLEIFRSMNFKFESPKKSDTCKPCGNKSKSDSSQADSSSMIELKDNAHKSKENDKLKSINHPEHKVVSFNLGQCLATPYLRLHSKSHKLWTYNLTVHDCATGDSHCFMWHEIIAEQGGNEIASCLFKYLTLLNPEGKTKTATFYSDSSLKQNKKIFVTAMFLFVLCFNKSISEINHKFVIPNLTRMECDDDLELIEEKRKESTVKIHHPRDWYNFVRTVKWKNPFNVIEMNQTDFFDFSALAKNKFVWPDFDEESNKFDWNEIKWLRYRSDNFGFIEYKTSLNENTPFKKINVKKCELREFSLNDLKSAYKGPRPISIEKKKDLLDTFPEIDSCFYNFYENLTTVEQLQNEPDITEYNICDLLKC